MSFRRKEKETEKNGKNIKEDLHHALLHFGVLHTQGAHGVKLICPKNRDEESERKENRRKEDLKLLDVKI